MTPRSLILPTHRAIRKYYEDRHALREQRVLPEMGLRPPFQRLLEDTAKRKKWTLLAELSEQTTGGRVPPHGTLLDSNRRLRGYGEAKDTQDDPDLAIRKKEAQRTGHSWDHLQRGVGYRSARSSRLEFVSSPAKNTG